ncbi:MAG: hypothetical protein QM744_11280 [Mesorhizobium sp.]
MVRIAAILWKRFAALAVANLPPWPVQFWQLVSSAFRSFCMVTRLIAAAAVLASIEPRAIAHCVLAERPLNARTSKLARALDLNAIFDSGFDGDSEQPLSGALALLTVKAAVASAI